MWVALALHARRQLGVGEVGAGDLRLVNENESVSRSVMHDCDPVDCSPPGSSIHGILQARTLQWVAMPSFRGSSRPRNRTQVFCTGR